MSEEITLEMIVEQISRGLPVSAIPFNPKCAICEDTGWIRHEEGNYTSVEKCSCLIAKESILRIKHSGLSHILDSWTLESFQEKTDWQIRMKETAVRYIKAIEEGLKPWLFVGGAVGSGKSHICTAVCGELLKKHAVRYFQWQTDARRLKGIANDPEAYDEQLYRFLNVEILYIDDLLKTKNTGTLNPTDADVKVAFELLNGRYAGNKPVIITSEWLLSELVDADEGTFSRVYEKAKGFRVEVKREAGRNQRMNA
jgi:DNA replication protein DnaC